MAKKTFRPGRTLFIFLICTAVLYGLVAIGGNSWTPRLGLDLEGGTRITLTAVNQPDPQKLNLASNIIRQRVNGSGVTEADVTTQGGKNIIVEIPGKNAEDLVNRVKKTAQLRFRLVAFCPQVTGGPCRASAKVSKPQAQPSGQPSSSPTGSSSSSPATGSGSGKHQKQGTSKQDSSRPRPAPAFAVRADGSNKSGGKPKADSSSTAKPKASPTTAPSTGATSSPAAPAKPAKPQPGSGFAQTDNVQAQLKWTRNPGTDWQLFFAASKCKDGEAFVPRQAQTLASGDFIQPKKLDLKNLVRANDDPSRPLISCDKQGNKLLMGPAVIEGTQLSSASAGQSQQSLGEWLVNLSFKSSAADTFAQLSRAMWDGATAYNGQYAGGLFAIVLDGNVLSSPGFNGVIPNGRAQISGGFTQTSAQNLANNLKYGALPVKFHKDVSSQTIGPSLAGNQLSAGLLAGAIGLLIVMLYCLLYYRGLGTVVISSLIVAAIVTYGVVLVLAQAAGFTLTLPGIAGLIVAVGITADSFIVYFERIRDEMRDGKSMRVAVQAGWKRARNTCLAADAVSILAAVVLYIFAIGVVRGFAFALGVSTLIDVLVFFFFTHPVITILSGHKFFNSGHRLSGLSPETLGVDRSEVDALARGRA